MIFGGWRCASAPPIPEYTIARTALQAAQDVEAARYASGFWHKSEEYYRKGEQAYADNDFGVAREFFEQAREYAEKAENSARLRKFQSGEGFP
ncbi:MAG: DUF4398 domain-containing protein [Bdellovibrionaceae bacterium]|nr:DUF4398 domain-containing protein [Bdellovibrionales bacterium]MCB9084824.1 DUF4398 domain-containing protein [Pseudobdellovibrionaceae bacterium]